MKERSGWFKGLFVMVFLGLAGGCGTSGTDSDMPPIIRAETSPSGETWTYTASVLSPVIVAGQSALVSDITVDVGKIGLSGETTLTVSGLPAGVKWGTRTTATDTYENETAIVFCEQICGESVVVSTQASTIAGEYNVTISVTRAEGGTLSSAHTLSIIP